MRFSFTFQNGGHSEPTSTQSHLFLISRIRLLSSLLLRSGNSPGRLQSPCQGIRLFRERTTGSGGPLFQLNPAGRMQQLMGWVPGKFRLFHLNRHGVQPRNFVKAAGQERPRTSWIMDPRMRRAVQPCLEKVTGAAPVATQRRQFRGTVLSQK